MSTAQVDPDVPDRGGPGPAADTAQRWADLVDDVLRAAGRLPAGAPPGAGVVELTRSTPDGIRIEPLHTRQNAPDIAIGLPGAPPYVRGTRTSPGGWDIRARHDDPDPRATREAVAVDLTHGVTSLWLVLGPGAVAVADLPVVLADVLLDLAPVVLDAGADGPEAAEAFLTLVADRAGPPVHGNLGLDPIGHRARTGAGPAVSTVVGLARRVAAAHPGLRAVVVDALAVPGAGGTDAQELGFSIAAGVAYLRALTAEGTGLDVRTAAGLLEFRYAATGEQFATIAKLRAARRLWSRVLTAWPPGRAR